MTTKRTAADCLIVAADFEPERPGEGSGWAESQVLRLADSLADLNVCIKVNSALRASGYGLIERIRDRNLHVFADLKLNDIPSTLKADGTFLRGANPTFITAMCSTGINALKMLKAELSGTEVLGVTVLTNQTDADTMALYGCSVREAVLRLADIAAQAGIDGLISSPDDLADLRQRFGNAFTYNTPGVRPTRANVKGDDQNKDRVMTPADAIKAGATRVVMGRPITRASDPRKVTLRTLDEIKQALA